MTSVGRLTREPIDIAALVRHVAHPAHGAIVVFLGVVREINDGRDVTGIEYSAYESMAAVELQSIASEAADRMGSANVVIIHRLGELGLEETSVGIAVAHAHRAEAYQLSRWTIEALKRRVPIWKSEHYTDGSREWVHPAASPVQV